MLTLGSAAAFCFAVALASAAAIAPPTSAFTAAPQASSAAWMRAWSGFAVAGLAATPTPATDGSASGGSAPSGRETSRVEASSVAQTWAAKGSAGSGGRSASWVVTPTWNGRFGAAASSPPSQAASASASVAPASAVAEVRAVDPIFAVSCVSIGPSMAAVAAGLPLLAAGGLRAASPPLLSCG